MTVAVPFFDPSRFYAAQREELQAAADDVLSSGRLVHGPHVEAFEREFADLVGTAFAVGVSCGTSALELGLVALELEAGSEVLCPNLTAPATAAAIVRARLRPVFVDVEDETLTINAVAAAEARDSGTSAIAAVHLYGRPAALETLAELGLPLVEDAAHAHGLELESRPAGSIGVLGCFSFYPTKNLGAFGDAGAVTTSDGVLADRIRSMRTYGEHARRRAEVVGPSARLDELQAAFLRVRLRRLRTDNARRAEIAARYDEALGRVSPAGVHHVYVVRSSGRDDLRAFFAETGIETAVHYPRPLSKQPAFSEARRAGSLAVSERAADEVLSVPCHPHLTSEEQARVASALERAAASFDLR